VLAGFASWSLLWPAVGLSRSLYLKELYVAGAYRRGGTGRMLIDGLHRITAERGCSRMEWATDDRNTGAIAFYEWIGAKPLASKVFYRAAVEQPGIVTGPCAASAFKRPSGSLTRRGVSLCMRAYETRAALSLLPLRTGPLRVRCSY